MKCDCGFEFEMRPGKFRNFDIAITLSGLKICICPECKQE
jgi:hypothetical protein